MRRLSWVGGLRWGFETERDISRDPTRLSLLSHCLQLALSVKPSQKAGASISNLPTRFSLTLWRATIWYPTEAPLRKHSLHGVKKNTIRVFVTGVFSKHIFDSKNSYDIVIKLNTGINIIYWFIKIHVKLLDLITKPEEFWKGRENILC